MRGLSWIAIFLAVLVAGLVSFGAAATPWAGDGDDTENGAGQTGDPATAPDEGTGSEAEVGDGSSGNVSATPTGMSLSTTGDEGTGDEVAGSKQVGTDAAPSDTSGSGEGGGGPPAAPIGEPGGGHGGGGGGGGHETTAGNNLSLPVIWSDGVQLALRGVFGEPIFSGVTEPADCDPAVSECWYLQQDPDNEWQAASVDAIAEGWGPIAVDFVDWGDNLEAKAWYTTSIVRVETVLYQDVSVAPLTGFTMSYLWGQGPSEMWGTNTVQYPSPEATVYSGCARMTIQKLTKLRDDPTLALAWDPELGLWQGDAGAPLLNSAVWEGIEGPDSPTAYSAEINIPGKVIYGYNWNVRRSGDGAGDYRLTFSLDALHCPAGLNTFFDDHSQILIAAEETATAAEDDGGSDTQGGIAALDVADNLTFIDVRILARGGGGSGH